VSVASFLEELSAWAGTRSDILGIAIVGSHARGTARADSDVDVVILCSAPALLLKGGWASRFGDIDSSALEDFGALQSLRVHYRSGLEVEFGVTDEAWARVPLDPGTKSALADGVRVIYDPRNLFRVAKDAAVA
jgi:predicted nucleotidyltransferase